MNSVHLVGRLSKDPQPQQTKTGKEMARFTLAVDRAYNDDEKKADFIGCVAFGKVASNICQYKRQGDMLAVEGRIQTGSYNKDGVVVYTTDIIADKVEFLSTQQGKGEKQATTQKDEKPAPKAKIQPDTAEPVPAGFAVIEEDIPF